MGITVDMYLSHHLVSGTLAANQVRPLDLLNNTLESFVILEDASVRGFHGDGDPMPLGSVRVQKDQLLAVVPHDAPRTMKARLEGAWVEKRPVRVMVGLGPLTVTGSFHVGQWAHTSLVDIGREAGTRPFVPATGARISSVMDPGWSLEVDSVFLFRTAMTFISLLANQDEEAPANGTPNVDELFRRFSQTIR